jgi:hypothetical protein
MGYDVDEIYGHEMKASEKLRKRQEKNDSKEENKKKKSSIMEVNSTLDS